jgi:hypothetical protein
VREIMEIMAWETLSGQVSEIEENEFNVLLKQELP